MVFHSEHVSCYTYPKQKHYSSYVVDAFVVKKAKIGMGLECFDIHHFLH